MDKSATGNVVINELVYDNQGSPDSGEFVELYNAGASPVDIGGWTLTGTPTSVVVPGAPGGFQLPAQ